jgi:hypothetical protein
MGERTNYNPINKGKSKKIVFIKPTLWECIEDKIGVNQTAVESVCHNLSISQIEVKGYFGDISKIEPLVLDLTASRVRVRMRREVAQISQRFHNHEQPYIDPATGQIKSLSKLNILLNLPEINQRILEDPKRWNGGTRSVEAWSEYLNIILRSHLRDFGWSYRFLSLEYFKSLYTIYKQQLIKPLE